MATAKDSFIKRALGAKSNAESRLRAVGGQIRQNVVQGQKDFDSGKAKYYDSVNPLKGTMTAFKNNRVSQ